VAVVMIGVDPHKGSHTAVAVDGDEAVLGLVRVRASAVQAQRLLEWAAQWPARTWAVEGAAGLGHLLAQELLAAGEQVLDVQPKLAARVWLLAAGAVNKNDPNDARSVAIAALRSPSCLPVRPDDHATVLKIWAKRHRDLSRARTQVACRLHAALCELVPGGVSKEIRATHAARLLEQADPGGAVRQARLELAAELTADLRRIDTQLRETRNKLAAAIRACGSTVTRVFGVGPVIAATVIGDVRDVSRFASRLYDIDRLISRTLAYAIVTGALVGLYAGLVLLATQVLTLKSPVAVAASTLVAAALFSPLRSRVQRAVDRRFNRARYDADQAVAAFAAMLKDAVDPDAVQADLAGVVQRALEPAHVSLWINHRG
jgi:transposase